MIDALPLGEIRGQHAPLDPTFGDIKNGIEHGPHAQGARASPAFGGGDQLLDPRPFFVGQVAWICLFIHISILQNPRRLFRQALRDLIGTKHLIDLTFIRNPLTMVSAVYDNLSNILNSRNVSITSVIVNVSNNVS
jgi:hypothetical protein